MKIDRTPEFGTSAPWLLRAAVIAAAVAMPLVAWMSQRGSFGPDNGTISNRYPTLLIAAGYAFSIWGLIFLGAVIFSVWQFRRAEPARGDGVARARPFALVGFAATALWMPVFSQQIFWLALALIWVALACLVASAVLVSRESQQSRPRALTLAAWLPLSLHAGWLSLAAFLNAAQVVVAYELAPRDDMRPWSMALFAIAAALLLAVNHLMRGNLAYVAAVLWGLVAVHLEQRSSGLLGANAAAWTAVAIAALLLAQTAWLLLGRARRRRAHA